MSIAQENLRRDVQARFQTDQHMSIAWIILPIIPFVISLIFLLVLIAAIFASLGTITSSNSTITGPSTSTFATSIFGFLVLLWIVIPITGIAWAVLLYKLVKRRNMHFKRQMFLYDDLMMLAKDLAVKKNSDISLLYNNLDRTSREAKFEETEKSAALWAILSFFIPILSLYVFYFLNKDFYRHERRQDIFTDDFARVLGSIGIPTNIPRPAYPIPDRSFVLYLVLTIITAGLFSIYWVYTLLLDPNNHFQYHAILEDTIVAQTGIGTPTQSYPHM